MDIASSQESAAKPWEIRGSVSYVTQVEPAIVKPKRGSALPLQYLYLLPMLLIVGSFLLYPAAKTLWLSFTDSNGLNEPKFIGLKNYTNLFTDPAFSTSFQNTLLWVVGVMVLQVTLGLIIAVVLSSVRGGDLVKTLLYLPSTISGAAVAVVWYFMFDPTQGVINTAFRAIHLGALAQDWLTTVPTNTWAMIVAATWQGLGPNMLLCLVGLQNIPRDPLEAGMLDGAGPVRLFWHITLPLLRPMLTVVVGIALINSFKVFDLIWVMTQGGPYRSSETLAVTMYRESFVSFELGYGAAIAIVLTIIVMVLSIFYLRAMFRKDVEVYG
jgi:multiple sugar transport system permease protein